jgi:hypothetical protein
LQRKIHLTLLHVDEHDIGESISHDPMTWPAPGNRTDKRVF